MMKQKPVEWVKIVEYDKYMKRDQVRVVPADGPQCLAFIIKVLAPIDKEMANAKLTWWEA